MSDIKTFAIPAEHHRVVVRLLELEERLRSDIAELETRFGHLSEEIQREAKAEADRISVALSEKLNALSKEYKTKAANARSASKLQMRPLWEAVEDACGLPEGVTTDHPGILIDTRFMDDHGAVYLIWDQSVQVSDDPVFIDSTHPDHPDNPDPVDKRDIKESKED